MSEQDSKSIQVANAESFDAYDVPDDMDVVMPDPNTIEPVYDVTTDVASAGLTMEDGPEEALRIFLRHLGFDPDTDDHLMQTPQRMVRMYRSELFAAAPVTYTTFPAETTGMIVQSNIRFVSVCAHHFLPFTGTAHVGYIPGARMVGLSKLARTVDAMARRPQVQERLTEQIANTLEQVLSPEGVGVVLEAEHFCMTIRGVQQPGTTTRTTALRGSFLDEPETRAEFLSAIEHRSVN